jgi:hypothetical protein
MYVTMSLSLYHIYSSLFYFILRFPFSFVGPKLALKFFLSKTLKIVSSVWTVRPLLLTSQQGCFTEQVVSLASNPKQSWVTDWIALVWVFITGLSGMGDLTSSYATVSIAP